MLAYLKGTAASILVAVFVLMLISIIGEGLESAWAQALWLLYFVGIFAYVCGVAGILLLNWTNQRQISQLLRYILFLVLGIASGLIMEFIVLDGELWPSVIIATTLGSLAFLASQQIASTRWSWALSITPAVLFFLPSLISNIQHWLSR